MAYELVPLHKNKHHKDDCTAILNEEWPRSKAAREHSLNKSCDSLPCCLVFRRTDNEEVVGYSQVVAVQGKHKACLFESVIIHKDLRGTGLGKRLMVATEQFAKEQGYQTAYLSTHDKQGFYAHLGYTECGPVTTLGANASRVSDEFLQKLLGKEVTTANPPNNKHGAGDQTNNSSAHCKTQNPPTPAPPPPPSCVGPPPPPPPPPPSKTKSNSKDEVSRHVRRLDPTETTWMQKSL